MDEHIICSFLSYQELVYTLLLIHSYLHFLIVFFLFVCFAFNGLPVQNHCPSPSLIPLWAFITFPISLLILVVIYYTFACKGANDWWSYKLLWFRVTFSIQALPIALKNEPRPSSLFQTTLRTHALDRPTRMRCQPLLGFRCQPSFENHASLNPSTTPSTIHNAWLLTSSSSCLPHQPFESWYLESSGAVTPISWASSDWGQTGCEQPCPTRGMWLVLLPWPHVAGGSSAPKSGVYRWHSSESKRRASAFLELWHKLYWKLGLWREVCGSRRFGMEGFDLLREVRGCFTAKVETELISEGKG